MCDVSQSVAQLVSIALIAVHAERHARKVLKLGQGVMASLSPAATRSDAALHQAALCAPLSHRC